jgi:hypothetical protein
MPFNVTRAEQTVFALWHQEFRRAYDELLAAIRSEVARMRSLGVSDREIFDRLNTQLRERQGIFARFGGTIESGVDKLTQTTAQIESNATLTDQDRLDWELDPTVKEHCTDCLRNAELEPRSFDDWATIGLPGAGNTECGNYCKCTLRPVP